jgi:Mce-associated membrane protein
VTAKETSVAKDSEKDADEVEDAEPTEGLDDSRPGRLNRFTSRVKKPPTRKTNRWSGKLGVAVMTLLLVASLSIFGGLFWFSYRPDRNVDAEAAKSAVAAASDGTIAILSYSPDTLDHDFSSARSHLTGEFLSYYDNFSKQIVAPAAKLKAVKTSAVVLQGALSEFHPDSAVVLLFVNQSTQTRDRPEPSLTSSTVLVTLTKADGKWLISQFNPA